MALMNISLREEQRAAAIKDLGLEFVPEPHRSKFFDDVMNRYVNALTAAVIEKLPESQLEELFSRISGRDTNDPTVQQEVVRAIQKNTPDLDCIAIQEYERIKMAVQKILPKIRWETQRGEILELLDRERAAAGEAIDLGGDLASAMGVSSVIVNSGLFLMDALWDPGSPLRTEHERKLIKNHRIFKRMAVLFASFVGCYVGLLIDFQANVTLNFFLPAIPIARGAPALVPGWFESLSIASGWFWISVIVILGCLAVFLGSYCFAKCADSGVADFLAKRKRIQDRDRLSYWLALEPDPYFILADNGFIDSMRAIYSAVFSEHCKPRYKNQQTVAVFKLLLERVDENEDGLLEFLIPKIRNPREAIPKEVKSFMKEASDFMSRM